MAVGPWVFVGERDAFTGALGHVGRWMDRRGVDAGELDSGLLHAFLADHVERYGQRPSAGVMPLLDYLRSAGVAAPEPKRRRSPLDAFLDEYRVWLAVERALSPDTVRGSVPKVPRSASRRQHGVGGERPGPRGEQTRPLATGPFRCRTHPRRLLETRARTPLRAAGPRLVPPATDSRTSTYRKAAGVRADRLTAARGEKGYSRMGSAAGRRFAR